jgi:hypothetical protein
MQLPIHTHSEPHASQKHQHRIGPIQAYASAMAGYLQQPDDYALGLRFLQTALWIERVDSVIAVLKDIAAKVSPLNLHLLVFQAELCEGNCAAAWLHLEKSGLAADSLAFHDCAVRIAFQQHDLPAALGHLCSMEQLAQRPLTHYLKKLEILKIQGKYAEAEQQAALLQRAIESTSNTEHRVLQLWQAGFAHSQHAFARSMDITGAIIADLLVATQFEAATASGPSAKPWTRQRQHLVIKDLERLILMHQLPLFMVAGSLLSLVREGDFFLADKDIDLGLLDADFSHAISMLINSGYFDDVSPPDYFVGYTQLRHRPTGFIVDVTHYQTKGEHIFATWGHTSGEVLRQTRFAKFALCEAYFASLRCRVLVPDDTDTYLCDLYGDWRTPDPYFDTVLAARNLCGVTPFLQSLGFIKIADALLNGRLTQAKAVTQQLHDAGFYPPLLKPLHDLL